MIVKIKTWNTMEKEFGLTSLGSIKCKNHFLLEMEKRMPKDRYIEVKINSSGLYKWNCWTISEDMIEKVNPYLEAMERL